MTKFERGDEFEIHFGDERYRVRVDAQLVDLKSYRLHEDEDGDVWAQVNDEDAYVYVGYNSDSIRLGQNDETRERVSRNLGLYGFETLDQIYYTLTPFTSQNEDDAASTFTVKSEPQVEPVDEDVNPFGELFSGLNLVEPQDVDDSDGMLGELFRSLFNTPAPLKPGDPDYNPNCENGFPDCNCQTYIDRLESGENPDTVIADRNADLIEKGLPLDEEMDNAIREEFGPKQDEGVWCPVCQTTH